MQYDLLSADQISAREMTDVDFGCCAAAFSTCTAAAPRQLVNNKIPMRISSNFFICAPCIQRCASAAARDTKPAGWNMITTKTSYRAVRYKRLLAGAAKPFKWHNPVLP